ncbi:phenol hydroxylase subunit [Halioxenophilus sp. WMMB6]|uniref:phenol hydroxylase subunit n=1 Tax=Halioxenophilus sp. WMMB6 TaxID=3073815 RepID=UPI00295F2463|nr:phenol hydroxylase subunit [Halioxenophilus sp. WMMB6]
MPIDQLPTDNMTKYVHVTHRSSRFVEFNFAIGDPSLYAELILPSVAFAEFCQKNNVQMLSEREVVEIKAAENRWRFGDLVPD